MSATPTGTGCTGSGQLLGNPGFETGAASPWSASSGVVSNNSSEPPHSGSWDAWMDGYGSTHTDTLSQAVTLPTGCTNYNFSFWLHIDTAETSTTTVYDTLKVQVLNSSGTVLRHWPPTPTSTTTPVTRRRASASRPTPGRRSR